MFHPSLQEIQPWFLHIPEHSCYWRTHTDLPYYTFNNIKCHIFQHVISFSFILFHMMYLVVAVNVIYLIPGYVLLNTLRPTANGRYYADHIFKRIYSMNKFRFFVTISLKFVSRVHIDDKSPFIQVISWHSICNKSHCQVMMTQFTNAYVRQRASMSLNTADTHLNTKVCPLEFTGCSPNAQTEWLLNSSCTHNLVWIYLCQTKIRGQL